MTDVNVEARMKGLYQHLISVAKDQGFKQELVIFEGPIEVVTPVDHNMGGRDRVVDLKAAVLLGDSKREIAFGLGEEWIRGFSSPGHVVTFGGNGWVHKRVQVQSTEELTEEQKAANLKVLRLLLRKYHIGNPAPVWGEFYTDTAESDDLHVSCWGNEFPFGGPEIGRGFERWSTERLATSEGLALCGGILIRVMKNGFW